MNKERTSWTGATDIKTQVQKLWDRGDLLASMVSNDIEWPRRLVFKTPTSSDIANHFDRVRRWITEVRTVEFCRIEMREVNHRIFGRNYIPIQAWIESLDDAVSLINKQKQKNRFAALVKCAEERHPCLLPWLGRRPLVALELYEEFPKLLSIVDWMLANPRPGIYLRQVSIPNIDTKFIETNQSVLAELFQLALPGTAISHSTKSSQFNLRFGFKDKPVRIRFRVLDNALNLVAGSNELQDVTLDIASFAGIDASSIDCVFIVENEVNFLAFPELSRSMVIFGSGYGLDMLQDVDWLLHCRVFYWGDIDTHGFSILNQAREHVPHIQSLLMDEATVLAHLDSRSVEKTPHNASDFRNLNDEERKLYYLLKANKYSENFRLEQERINWDFAVAAISAAHAPKDRARFTHRNTNLQTSQPPLRLGARELIALHKPTECDLRVFLKLRNIIPDPSDSQSDGSEHNQHQAFEDVIKELSARHIAAHRNTFTTISDLSELLFDDRVIETKRAIERQDPVIYKPLFAVPVKLGGFDTIVVGEPDFLILDQDECVTSDQSALPANRCSLTNRYAIREAKLAKRITKEAHPEILLEIQLYGWLLNRVIGQFPVRLEVLNGCDELVSVEDDRGRAAIIELTKIAAEQMNDEFSSYCPVGWSKCSPCEYRSKCWNAAQQSRDVSLLVGVDQNLAKTLHRVGVPTIEQLLDNFDETRLASIQPPHGSHGFQQVGESKAKQILLNAKAISARSHIKIGEIGIPQSEHYVMFDLEGMPPLQQSNEKIYLWGLKLFGSDGSNGFNGTSVPNCLSRPNDKSAYRASIAPFNKEGDRTAWFRFLDNANAIFEQIGNAPFIHWHHFERSKMKMYLERFGDQSGIAGRIIDNMIDLLPIMQSTMALPLPTYGLKAVEKYVGFKRSQKAYGGDWAIAKFIHATETGDEDARNALLDEILVYNEEDLDALWTVFRWLQKSREVSP